MLMTWLTAETEEDVIKRLNEWMDNVENTGMRVTMNKTQAYNKWRTSGANAQGCKMALWCTRRDAGSN